MFQPDDPLTPHKTAFEAPWQAQTLALAARLVETGKFTAAEWAEALGAELKIAEADNAPDTPETYYACAITALERLSEVRIGISQQDRAERKADWEGAYRRTPHGKPVEI